MKQLSKAFVILSILIIVLAGALRLYQLGNIPHGMTWDEAAIGYNGFAIFHTRRDEWLHRVPISFKSFGDYKSPLAIYLNGPFTFLLGMNLFAVRLPFALVGTSSVVAMILLTYLLAKRGMSEDESKVLGLAAGLITALSPWHIHFSRIGFESGMALSFLMWGVVCLLYFFDCSLPKSKAQSRKQIAILVLSVLFAVASFYTYHSAKIVTPLVFLAVAATNWNGIKLRLKQYISAGIFGGVLLLPLMKDSFFGNGGDRFGQATVFGQHLPLIQLIQVLSSHTLAHFSAAYLIFGQTVTLRHGDGHWGILYLTDLLLGLAGLIFFLLKGNRFLQNRRMLPDGLLSLFLATTWVIVGTLPAVIGTDVPHGNRAILAFPGFVLLAVLGGFYLLKWLSTTSLDKSVSGSKGETHLLVKSVLGVTILFHALFSMSYLHDYYTTFAHESANDFQDGFIEAFQFAVKNEPTSDQILISDTYGQAYIFALFVRQTNPIWYQGGSMIKYVYLHKLSEGDLARKNTVLMATPDQIPPEKADQLVYGSDGKVKFVLVKTK